MNSPTHSDSFSFSYDTNTTPTGNDSFIGNTPQDLIGHILIAGAWPSPTLLRFRLDCSLNPGHVRG